MDALEKHARSREFKEVKEIVYEILEFNEGDYNEYEDPVFLYNNISGDRELDEEFNRIADNLIQDVQCQLSQGFYKRFFSREDAREFVEDAVKEIVSQIKNDLKKTGGEGYYER